MQSIFQLRSHTNRRQFQQEITQVVTKGLLFIRGKTAPELSYLGCRQLSPLRARFRLKKVSWKQNRIPILIRLGYLFESRR